MNYISLNNAVTELLKDASKNKKFFSEFLDKIGEDVVISFVEGNIFGTDIYKGIDHYSYFQVILTDFLKYSYVHIYGVKCLKGEKINNKLELITYESKYRWGRYNNSDNLNSIVSHNNVLLYTDVSIRKIDLDFLIKNFNTYLNSVFPLENKTKKNSFSVMNFIKFWNKKKDSTELDNKF